MSYSWIWLHFGKMSQKRVGLPQLGLQSGLLSLQGGRRLCQPTWSQSMPSPSPLWGVATSVLRSQWHTTVPPTWCSFGVSLIPSWLPHFDPSREEWSLAVRVSTPRVCTFEENFPRWSQNFKIWMLRNTLDKNKPSFSLFSSSIWKETVQYGRKFHSHNTSRRICGHLCPIPPPLHPNVFHCWFNQTPPTPCPHSMLSGESGHRFGGRETLGSIKHWRLVLWRAR